jgi:hypothetical protein
MFMKKTPRHMGATIVQLPLKAAPGRNTSSAADGSATHGALADAGSPGDPRMQEALRLAKAFLAIEDAAARSALVTLAEQLTSHEWARRLREI